MLWNILTTVAMLGGIAIAFVLAMVSIRLLVLAGKDYRITVLMREGNTEIIEETQSVPVPPVADAAQAAGLQNEFALGWESGYRDASALAEGLRVQSYSIVRWCADVMDAMAKDRDHVVGDTVFDIYKDGRPKVEEYLRELTSVEKTDE